MEREPSGVAVAKAIAVLNRSEAAMDPLPARPDIEITATRFEVDPGNALRFYAPGEGGLRQEQVIAMFPHHAWNGVYRSDKVKQDRDAADQELNPFYQAVSKPAGL